jgi:hypothetical protein
MHKKIVYFCEKRSGKPGKPSKNREIIKNGKIMAKILHTVKAPLTVE